MNQIVSKPGHSDPIGFIKGEPVFATPQFQAYLDDIEQKLNSNLLGSHLVLTDYTVATLPDPTPNGWIHVIDETGGPVPAYSDGTDWRRASDGNIVS